MSLQVAGHSAPSARGGEIQGAFVCCEAGGFHVAAVFDGTGGAAGVARRAAALLEAQVAQLTLGAALRDDAWATLIRTLDLALAGGSEATIVCAAMIGNTAIVVSAGDSCAIHVPLEGQSQILSHASRRRLGSGEVRPFLCRKRLAPRDVLVLASDGLYAPLGLAGVDRIVRDAPSLGADELSRLLVEAAGQRGGRLDDATAVALRFGAAR